MKATKYPKQAEQQQYIIETMLSDLMDREIICETITLHFVMQWIEIKSKHNISLDTKGIMFEEGYHGELDTVCEWDFRLADNLYYQLQGNPPLVNFLYSLI